MPARARQESWRPQHVATALDELRRHLNKCPVCRTWKPTFSRNPHCNNLRLLVNKVTWLWSQVPAGSRSRQIQMFGEFQTETEGDPPPF